MNIYIDTSPLANDNAIRGVGRYTKELVEALQTYSLKHAIYTDKKEIQGKIDIVHYPFFDLFFPTLPLVKTARTIVTIHDVIPLLFPKHYPRGIKGNLNFFRQKLALRSARHIITDSQASLRDIVDHLGVRQEKITVVPLAASPSIQRPSAAVLDAVRRAYGLPKNFALYVGDMNYNKNLPFLIRVFKRIPKLTLVLVGKTLNNTHIPEGKALHHAISSLGMQKRVRILDTVASTSAVDLAAIYALATVYVQPSLYEGFGLPVLEAMQCRTPVVCSRGGSLPEVVGDAALLFHPHDEEECKQMIERVLRMSESQKTALLRKGTMQAHQFSWEKTARLTLSVYEQVGG